MEDRQINIRGNYRKATKLYKNFELLESMMSNDIFLIKTHLLFIETKAIYRIESNKINNSFYKAFVNLLQLIIQVILTILFFYFLHRKIS